jgi:hypothetical protein
VFLAADGTLPTTPVPMGPSPGAGYAASHVFCAGRYVNSVWRPPSVNDRTLSRLAIDLAARAWYPSVRLGVNPTRGITGLASWFWAERSADDPVRMLLGFGPEVFLELRVDNVRWRFGDGTPRTVTGLGAPYPSSSPVQHVYERKGTYTVEARVLVVGRVRGEEVDFDTPPGGHTVVLRHEVAEVRSLLHVR